MSANPYLEWPLWHYFTLHMQNVVLVDDEFRATTLGNEPRTLDDLSRFHPVVHKVVMASRFYNYVDDVIVDGSSLPPETWIADIGALRIKSFSGDQEAMVIVKGVATRDDAGRVSGGELFTMLGKLVNQKTVASALAAARKISNGELVPKINVMEKFSEPDRQRVLSALKNPVYDNATIQSILKSYRIVSTGKAEMEKNIAKIKSTLSKSIPPDKAIHVSSGHPVEISKGRYHIAEYTVRIPDSGTEKTVKFAFKSTMKEDERQAYERMLVENFQARPAQTGIPSPERREAISLAPVVFASTNAYQSIFPRESQSIIPYLRTLRGIVEAVEPSRIQSLHTEEQIEEEMEEEDEGINTEEY